MQKLVNNDFKEYAKVYYANREMPDILEMWFPNTKEAKELIDDFESNWDFIIYLINKSKNKNLSEDQKEALKLMDSEVKSRLFLYIK